MRQVGDSVPKRVVIGAQAKQQSESPMPNCTVEAIELEKVGRRVIAASFDGGEISSDAGVLLLRRADERIGLTQAVARVFADARRAASVTHAISDLLRQRLYALCCGWEDVTGHNTLRHDLALQTAVGRDQALASGSTLCMNSFTAPGAKPGTGSRKRSPICLAGAPVATSSRPTSYACCWPRWPTPS